MQIKQTSGHIRMKVFQVIIVVLLMDFASSTIQLSRRTVHFREQDHRVTANTLAVKPMIELLEGTRVSQLKRRKKRSLNLVN